jgi:hypothetical protein
VVEFLLEPLDLVLGLGEVLLQGASAVERGGAGTGADPHPILGHAVQVDQVLVAEHGHREGQQLVEELEVVDAEIGQGVITDRDASGQPLEGVVMVAEPGQGAGTADAFEGGVEPDGDEDAGVDRRSARAAFDGPDPSIERGQVELRDEVPDDPGLMVGIEEVLQRHGGEELLAIGHDEARFGSRNGGRGGRGRKIAHGQPLTGASGDSPPLV